MFAVTFPVRDAADLGAGVATSSKWAPCYGARFVVFEWRATNTQPLQVNATPVEGCNLDPNPGGQAIAAATLLSAANALIAAPVPSVAGISLANVGSLRCTVLPLSGHSAMVTRYVRMNVTGNAGATVTGLSCIAHVFYDELAGIPTGTAAI